MSPFSVTTYGCKVNTYDSGLLQSKLQGAGFELSGAPQVHILNSCAVTAEATREALREARRLKKKDPHSLVVLTGCAAQVDGALVDQSPDLDLVVANSHKEDLPRLLADKLAQKQMDKVYRANIFRNESLGLGGGSRGWSCALLSQNSRWLQQFL
jgi:threonylcarbamoyladenosine tRNA methylthiotransferase MtaB